MAGITIPASQQQPQDPNVTYTDVEQSFKQLFPTIPAVDDPSPPDLALLQVVDDLADFAQDTVQTAAADPTLVPTGVRSLAFNWDAGELWLDSTGAPLIVEDEDTVVQWVLACANTIPGVFAVFTPDYGNSVLDLIGVGIPNSAFASEVSRAVEESFSAFSLITSIIVEAVQTFPTLDRNGVFVTITIGTVFSEDDQELTIGLAT
jgi:hypothetical protein